MIETAPETANETARAGDVLAKDGTSLRIRHWPVTSAEPWATLLLVHMPEARREGFDVESIPSDYLRELVSLVKAGVFAKEAVPDVLRAMARDGSRASEAVATLGLTRATPEEIDRVVAEVVSANRPMIAERGREAESALMGLAMERLRGRADGRAVSEAVRRHLERAIAG